MVIHETVPYILGNQQEIPVDFPGGRGAPGDSLLVSRRLNFHGSQLFERGRFDILSLVITTAMKTDKPILKISFARERLNMWFRFFPKF